MKKTRKFNFKTSIVLILSLLLCLTSALSVACSSDSSSSSSSSAEEETIYPTDYQTITNGDFEFSTFTKDDDDFPVSSSIGWTQSRDSITTSAPSSTYGSGIINTDDDAYAIIAKTAGFDEISDGVYYNPHTPAYYGLVENEYVYSEDTENEDGIPTNGSKILMIHNQTSTDGEGTAQKFTSSTSLTLAKHEYAKVSVWVSTHDLTSNVNGVDYGAYIAIQNTTASTTTPFVIKNINTNDSWVKYTVYLSSSDFSTSSFKVILGLGFGSSKIRREFVQGYAYFDNVHYEVIDKTTYEAGINNVATDNAYALYEINSDYTYSVSENLTADQAGLTFTDTTAYEKQTAYNEANAYTENVFSLSHNRASLSFIEDPSDFDGVTITNKLDGSTINDKTQVDIDTLSNALTAIGNDLKAPDANLGTATTVYFNHTTPTTSSVNGLKLEVAANHFYKLSFWVKVNVEYKNQAGLTVTLNDYGTGVSTPVKTTIANSIVTDDDENENFNGWREYIIYLSNTVEGEDVGALRRCTLDFDFGITQKSDQTDGNWSLTKGYAIVTAFNVWYLTEDDYNNADTSTYSYATKVALSADLPNGIESETTDSYDFGYGATDNVTIKTTVASNVTNYTGIVGNSKAVGGENDNVYSHTSISAGVINTEYLDNYVTSNLLNENQKDAIALLDNSSSNKYLQPIMIKNGVSEGGVSYGFFGQSASLSANTTTLISVDVYVLGTDAEAYIYLANSNALNGFEVLQLNAKDYTYTEADGLTVSDSNKISQDFAVKVTSNDCTDGWFTVQIMITTGENAISYRPEFWLGQRDGSSANYGVVLFNNYNVSTSTSVATLKQNLAIEGDTVSSEYKYTRMPTKITSTDENDSEKTVVTYKTNYEETTVFAIYNNSKTIIADYSTIDVTNEIDNTTTSDDDEDEDTTTSSSETSFSWALQITSIIIVVVLLVLLVVVLIRTILKNRGSRRKIKAGYYDRNGREYAALKADELKAKRANKANSESDDEEEVVAPYDYDNIENNFVDEEATKETVEATDEEAVEETTEETTEEVTTSDEE